MAKVTTTIAAPQPEGEGDNNMDNPFTTGINVALEATGASDKNEATVFESELAKQCVIWGTLMAQQGDLLSDQAGSQKEVLGLDNDRKGLLISACKKAQADGANKRGLRSFIQAIYKACESKLMKTVSTDEMPTEKDGKRVNRAPGMVVGLLRRQAGELWNEYDEKDARNHKVIFRYGKKKSEDDKKAG